MVFDFMETDLHAVIVRMTNNLYLLESRNFRRSTQKVHCLLNSKMFKIHSYRRTSSSRFKTFQYSLEFRMPRQSRRFRSSKKSCFK
jgi:hypothetical protein